MKIKFKIATPERVVYEAEVDSVTCPTQMGEITILPNHIPLVANLAPGEMKFLDNGQERYLAVSGGFLEVRPKNEVIVLADSAEYEEEVDLARALEARKRAQKLMSEKIMGEEEYAETAAALERSLVRIKLGRRKKYRDVGKTTH
jgi:F-type H+-transporting ATPase subunit epsilon